MKKGMTFLTVLGTTLGGLLPGCGNKGAVQPEQNLNADSVAFQTMRDSLFADFKNIDSSKLPSEAERKVLQQQMRDKGFLSLPDDNPISQEQIIERDGVIGFTNGEGFGGVGTERITFYADLNRDHLPDNQAPVCEELVLRDDKREVTLRTREIPENKAVTIEAFDKEGKLITAYGMIEGSTLMLNKIFKATTPDNAASKIDQVYEGQGKKTVSNILKLTKQ